MQEYFNKLRATVTIQITGAYPGDLINRLAEAKLTFWDLHREDELTWRVTMFAGDYKKIAIHAKRAMCRVHIIKKEGLPFFTRRFKRRTALITGLTLCLAAAVMLPRYIWYFEVEGNDTVPTQQIIRALDDIGVGIGSYGPSIRAVRIKNRILLEIPELSWLTINVSGGKATVIVRERIEKPELLDERLKTDLIADKTGIITKMEILRGKPLAVLGQTVLAGELLVSGEIPYENGLNTVQTVRSMGEVYARTWYKLNAQIPKTYSKKSYTGQNKVKYSIIIFNKKINLFINSGNTFPKYDKIIEIKQLNLPGGASFPVAIEKAVYNEYETQVEDMDLQTAEQILQLFLKKQIAAVMGPGEVKLESYKTADAGDFISVTLNAECEEQIAREVESPLFN